VERLLDALLPPRCPGCRREGSILCDACLAVAGRRLAEPAGVPLGLRAPLPEHLVQLEWCGTFTGATRSALHALKYDGERRLARPLGGLLAARWRRAVAGGDLLVPVPIHPAKLRERGFNQASLLAREAGRRLRIEVAEVLTRTEATRAQHALGRTARAENVAAVFSVTPAGTRLVRDRWVVLVDDVVTTGATLSGCARVLRRSGAIAVSGLAVARER
jgi:ComF family protein